MKGLCGPLMMLSALAAACLPCFGEESCESHAILLQVELEDGSRIVGSTKLRTLKVDSASLGTVEAPLGMVRSVVFSDDREAATITLKTKEVLRGTILPLEFELETLFGKVTIPMERVLLVKKAEMMGLVAHYPFNGNAHDASGNGNHGRAHGAVLAKDRSGIPNMAYYFEPSDDKGDWIDCGKAEVLGIGGSEKSFTICLWANPAHGGKKRSHAFGMGVPDVNKCVTLGLGDAAAVAFLSFAGEGNSVRSRGAPVGEWHHWVGTYHAETNTRRIYRDGVVAAENKAPEDFPGRGTVYIGNSPWMNSPFHGTVNDVRIYTRALSESEVHVLYCAERQGDVLHGEQRGREVCRDSDADESQVQRPGLADALPGYAEPAHSPDFGR